MRIILIKWCSVLLTLSAIYSPNVSAASDAECGIWLCLPTGFTSGCGEARSAFWSRIKSFKSPLPGFHECIKSAPNTSGHNADNFTSQTGIAAQIASYKVCTQTKRIRRGGEWQETCVAWETVPATVIKGVRCRIDKEGHRSPAHCTKTLRYTEVYRNGQLFGQTHYY
ncbi:hypothetical protein [Vibrio maritimus]|uniref:hypothetical protein n=1 Tax=Vibrio maritimus TaxID=990268 RepID=UPI001F2CD14B|nr:hypothetical protein [Vibrio maritimus]